MCWAVWRQAVGWPRRTHNPKDEVVEVLFELLFESFGEVLLQIGI
jgi:hypothetical protein